MKNFKTRCSESTLAISFSSPSRSGQSKSALSKSRLVLIGCLLFACLAGTAYADVITVLDHDFETDPPNFEIQLQETGDATASFEFGDIGGSRGMIFKGTYLTKEGVDVFEYANGVLSPLVPTHADYHLYPDETDGIYSITVSIDAILEGLPGDDGGSDAGMGFTLRLWQLKNGMWDKYRISQLFQNRNWASIGWANLTAEDFQREDGTMPDFSATAAPMVFSFFVGIGYKWVSGPGRAFQTSARVDNWKVEADVGLTLFKDSFE